VISVDTAHRLAGGGTVTGRALAVRGWMSAILLPGPCAVPDAPAGRGVVSDPLAPEAAFCRRVAILRESPIRESDVAHLHPQLLPGTGLGDATAALSVTGGDRVPIVLLAHFGDPRLETCASGDPRCGEEVVVDRVLWVAGQSIEPPTAVRPIPTDPAPRRAPADAGAIVDEAFIGVRVTSIAGVPAGDLGKLEPAAAAAGHGTDYVARAGDDD
jgi:hypothetical protein